MTMKRGHMPTQCRHTHEITEQSFDLVLSGMPASTTGSTKTTVLWMASPSIIHQSAPVWGVFAGFVIGVASGACADARCKNRFMPPLPDRTAQPHNPLHGLTLEAIVTALAPTFPLSTHTRTRTRTYAVWTIYPVPHLHPELNQRT